MYVYIIYSEKVGKYYQGQVNQFGQFCLSLAGQEFTLKKALLDIGSIWSLVHTAMKLNETAAVYIKVVHESVSWYSTSVLRCLKLIRA